jgi:hypothetical protein
MVTPTPDAGDPPSGPAGIGTPRPSIHDGLAHYPMDDLRWSRDDERLADR